jgi:hypothetical protein
VTRKEIKSRGEKGKKHSRAVQRVMLLRFLGIQLLTGIVTQSREYGLCLKRWLGLSQARGVEAPDPVNEHDSPSLPEC